MRREWAERLGLTDFASPKYDRALDAVCERLSVHTGERLRGGCRAGAGAGAGAGARAHLLVVCCAYCVTLLGLVLR